MQRTDRSATLRYGAVVLSVAVVTLIRLLLHGLLGGAAAFLPFEIAVMFSAWYGGLKPGLLATALAVLVASYLFVEPIGHVLSIAARSDAVQLVLFSAIGAVISFVIDNLQSAVAEREQAEQTSQAQARTLIHMIEQLSREHRLEEFPGIVLAAIVDQLGAPSGSLWIYDEENESSERVLEYSVSRSLSGERDRASSRPKTVEHRGKPGWEGIKRRFLRGETIVFRDAEEDAFLDPDTRSEMAAQGVQTLLVVPLLLQGRLTGYCGLRSTRRENYGPRALELAQALAQQATLAMQLTRLSEQSRQTAVLEERNRMAREIHDTLAQAFTGIILQLGAAGRVPPERGQEHLQLAGDLAREGLAEARRSVQGLRPQALEEMDLAAALARMTEQLNAGQSTRIEFHRSGAPRPLPPDVAGHLLRIGQEALTNALRHAQASAVGVELTFAGEELRLCVEDDGRGFPMNAPRRKSGFGLTGLHERAGIIGAQLTVASQPGSGTRVELAWPFPPG
jgi:signal transduction histidine kinase